MHESETDEKKKRLTKNSETYVYISKLSYAKNRVLGRFGRTFTANVNLYHVTKFSLYLSFAIHNFSTGIGCF